MTKAYVLIESTVGKVRTVATALKDIQEVSESYLVTGPYDVVAILRGDNPDHVTGIVTSKVHSIPGIARTITCLDIEPDASGEPAH